MLKVLHTGDWHIGSFPGPEVGGQNARFQDICRCLDFQAMYAEEHRPDLIVVSGDIFHQARVWSDRGLRESRTAIDHIRRLSNVAPTVVLRGTPNHDSEEQFEMLTTAFYGDDSVSVVTEPEVLHIHTYHGQHVDVACIPGFDRGVHRAAHPGLSREEETQVFTDELAKVVLGLKAQCEPGVTSILSTHFTVPGCNMESGQTALFAQFEPVIYPATLKAADFDLVALGHIHRPQQLPEAGRAVFYCGSITGLNFNDENQPRGFYIHDIDDDGEAWSEYVETPYREFETIRLGEDDVHAMLSAERVVVPDRLKGKIVRVLYTCSDETNKAFNKAVLEKRLYDGGVFYVSEITPEEITTSVNRDELHGDNSPEQNLAEYLTEKEKSPEDAQRIIELARPIISEAMEKGRLETPTGVFMPVEIEVKNYRNYRDELFSYDGISFATINGENGAGKSSLFMDAMLDALFEEPREGDLTGWICNDPDARSGSIKFTFYLGDKLYRVTRTRTKSGKATLNLSEYVDESWQNRSAEKYRDTQTIIENTIGMDSLTLKATGLIMQDQYGLFLQADKADRMAILGNILGLGIYDRMESMAANRAADANRELRRIADLQEETGRAMPDKFDAATYPGATDPKLDGKPVMVLAVKGENPDNCTYSFLNMAALVDTYAAKTTGKDASTTVTIAGYEVDVKVNVSAAAGNALILKDDGLYVPTPEEVDISGKADKVTGATTGNFAALDGEGNLTDSGKKPADFVGAEAGKRLMSDAEGEKLAGVSEGATKTAASSTNGNVNIDGKEVVVYTEPENVLHDEDVEDFSAEEIAALLADAD